MCTAFSTKKKLPSGSWKHLQRIKGIAMEQIHGVDYQTFKETQYDILADALREHLDMKKIYQILEEGA